MNPWKFVHKREVTFTQAYRRHMEMELLMALVFEFDDPLMMKFIELSDTRAEIENMVDLLQMPWDVEITFNGNVRVFNT